MGLMLRANSAETEYFGVACKFFFNIGLDLQTLLPNNL